MKKEYWPLVPIYSIICMAVLIVSLFISRTATVMAELKPLQNRHCIIIDAGHGGVDGGATSCTGVLESGLNLEISLRLDDLMHLLGYNTKMVRTTDVSIYTQGETISSKKISDLKERVKLVNDTPYGILVSIHQNFFQESKYAGAQVFYGKSDDSKSLAKLLQDNLKKTINIGSRRIEKKASGVYLMENIECTGILLECGFLSNPQEEEKLRDPNYQKQLCCVISASIAGFLS